VAEENAEPGHSQKYALTVKRRYPIATSLGTVEKGVVGALLRRNQSAMMNRTSLSVKLAVEGTLACALWFAITDLRVMALE
jgi:hypothetical protein